MLASSPMSTTDKADWKILELGAAGETSTSEAELSDRALRLATVLGDLGVGAGDRVCYMMENCIPIFEIISACQMSGIYPVPINYHFKSEEAGYILADSGAKALIATGSYSAMAAEAAAGIDTLAGRCLVVRGQQDGFLSYDDALTDTSQRSSDALPSPGVVIYTSGTTGNPKGVMREAYSPDALELLVRMFTEQIGFGPDTVHLVSGPLYHSAPNAFASVCLLLGGRLVVMGKYDSERLLETIERYKVTNAHLVPTMMHRLLALPEEVRSRYDLSSLKNVQHAAAPCPPKTKEAMIEWWGPVIEEYYGSTESGINTYIRSEEALRKPGSVGRVIEGMSLAIFDDKGDECGPGEVGDVFIGSPFSKTFQYHGDPEKRGKSVKHDMFTNGDMGYLDEDGYLFLSDRRADMVISGGVNIYPAEIEAVLHSHPEIADCAVFGIPDEEWGEALHAVVQAEPDTGLTLERLKSYCAEHLAGYKVPRSIELADDLPRQPSGKIYKRKLREPFWQDRESSIV